MEIQEIKIDGITYVKNERSSLCNDCAFIGECCNIIVYDKKHPLCALFSGHALKKVKDEHEK